MFASLKMFSKLNQLKEIVANAVGNAVFATRVVGRLGVVGRLTPRGLMRFARRLNSLTVRPHHAVMLHASSRPQAVALVANGLSPHPLRLTYAEFDAAANQMVNAIRAHGVKTGAKVGLMMHNCSEYMIAQEGLPRMGAAAVQIGYRLKAAEVGYIVEHARPAVLIVGFNCTETAVEALELVGHQPTLVIVVGSESAALAPLSSKSSMSPIRQTLEKDNRWLKWETALSSASAADIPHREPSDGGSLIVYTSGTTGKPKGAKRMLSETRVSPVLDLLNQIGARADESHLVTCPLYHAAAPAFTKMVLSLGGKVVLASGFDAENVLKLIARERITSAFMVPTQLARLASLDDSVRRCHDTSSLRWVMSGAAPLPTETAAQFQRCFGPILWNFYGATETGTVSLAGPADHAERPGTVGRLLRDNHALLLDDFRQVVKVGEIGELWIRNGMIIGGYHNNTKATAEACLDGYFSVGDLARFDEDGYLYMESRKHDMIISGGVNIYPREIEEVLHRHPAIREAAILGVPSLQWGESVCAFVVRSGSAEIFAEEIVAYCRRQLADYKCPKRVEFLDELPRNPTGKVLKRVLRQLVSSERRGTKVSCD